MSVSGLEIVFSLSAEIDMQANGISEDMVFDTISSGTHRKISETHGFYKSTKLVGDRVVGVTYVRRPPDGNTMLVAMAYWTRP